MFNISFCVWVSVFGAKLSIYVYIMVMELKTPVHNTSFEWVVGHQPDSRGKYHLFVIRVRFINGVKKLFVSSSVISDAA